MCIMVIYVVRKRALPQICSEYLFSCSSCCESVVVCGSREPEDAPPPPNPNDARANAAAAALALQVGCVFLPYAEKFLVERPCAIV